MDSIFDEDVDEVGGEIEAYCPSPRCKADTTHTIISMYEDEVRRVQCVVCGDVHAYRKPRGDAPEESTLTEAPRKRLPAKPHWEDALSRATDVDFANCRPYSIRDTYEEGDLISHPVFDIGMVTELLPDNKVEVLFKELPPRILVHNRGDLAQRMPGISEAPPPREVKKKKRAKKKDEAPPVLIKRNPKELADALDIARRAAQAKVDGGAPPKPAVKGAAKPVAPAKAPEKEAAKGKAVAKAPAKPEPKAAAKGAAKAPPAKAAPPAKKAAAAPVAKKAAAAPAPKKAAAPAKKAAPPAKKAAPAKKPAPAKKKPAPAKKPAAKAKKKK